MNYSSSGKRQMMKRNQPRQQKEIGETGYWTYPSILVSLQEKAKKLGLWNLFLPVDSASVAGFDEYGGGLTNRQYAELCEIMGTSNHMEFAAQVQLFRVQYIYHRSGDELCIP